ncbi:hypothetical protein [Kutzneria sp. CA-103260]|uniref:hypothetical protein n=1 Tax=Kutzneria sp. CA-103260 TaxID=2802641 RepID=UPI001BA912B5|nr:hypothetical protein [Kutzneria sp. CA-103260]
MTEYAYDRTRNALLAVWSVGIGNVAETAVAFGEHLPDPEDALQLGYDLTHLSNRLWHTYTHPLTAAVDQPEEALRRARDQLAVGLVTEALREPNLPVGNQIRICESAVMESAHRVGRTLHRIADGRVTDQAVADVEAEVAAMRQAALGDLTGRANQAVVLTRLDPQPQQVAAAHAYFEQVPMGPPELYTKIDATSASVAAVHWFSSAIMIARRASEDDPSDAPPTRWPMPNPAHELGEELPMQAMRRLALGESPRDIVIGMVRNGVTARTLLEELVLGIDHAWQLYRENNKSVPSHQIDETFLARTTRMAVEGRDRIL